MAESNSGQDRGPGSRVQRQIKLPMSKAVEIAYKNIRMRLSRSLLVTSGIVLALAFLMYILADEAIVGGMRNWIETTNEDSGYFAGLNEERAALQEEIEQMRSVLGAAAVADAAARDDAAPADGAEADDVAGRRDEATADAAELDVVALFGDEWLVLQREFRGLPASAEALERALRRDPELIPVMQNWVALNRRLVEVRREWNAPQHLEAEMRSRGVPTTPEQIAQDRAQTRWIIGLALLVAFVGILNAMLMSVTERFREIGTMKCLGALDSFIVKLFLIESTFQGAIGTVIGIALGLMLSMIGVWSAYGGYMWRMFPYELLLYAALICFVVGVGLTISGAVYPAWQAARMQPIEAMRVET